MELVSPTRLLSASGEASTSSRRPVQPPTSAMASTPALLVAPLSTKTTSALCTPPTRREKCAPAGTPPGVTALVQAPLKVTVYSALDANAAAASLAGGLSDVSCSVRVSVTV